MKNKIIASFFILLGAFFLLGAYLPGFGRFTHWAPGAAVLSGVIFALVFGNPFFAYTSKLTHKMLGVAIVGMGFGMHLGKVLAAGASGILLTAAGIAAGMGLGIFLGKRFGVSRDGALLLAAGTSICGGSAIAAVAPVLKAKPHDVATAIATVFILNAAALFLFPWIGHMLDFSQEQFGLFAALAIHDTSSVVGASCQYGETALEIGTTVKLARALWIVPLTMVIAALAAQGGDEKKKFKLNVPWFIPGFLIAAALATYIAPVGGIGGAVKGFAQSLMILTLFLIGANLSKEKIREVGFRPFLTGLALWLILGSAWCAYIHFFARTAAHGG